MILLTTNESITIHMKLIFPLTPIYIPTKVTMSSTTYESIAYALCNHLPLKLCLIKPSFYPFMNIHETTFMHVSHTMNQLWCDGDFNNGGNSFHNSFIWGNMTWWCMNRFLQYPHIQTLSWTEGAPWWNYVIQLHVSIAIHFFAWSYCASIAL